MAKVTSEISMSLDGFITGSGYSRISALSGSNYGGQARSRHRAPPTSDSKW